MILAVENFVLFSTCFALVSFAVAYFVRSLARQRKWQLSSHALTRLYTLSLLTPPVFAAWIVAAAFLPQMWIGEASFDAAHFASRHELHLFGNLTARLEPTLAYGVIVFVVAASLFILWSSLRSWWRIGRVIQKLEMNAAAPPPEQIALVGRIAGRERLEVGLVMSDYPFSFVWGFWHSKLILSSGLLRTLNAEELLGVMEHEAAHHSRRDNLSKLILSACGYTSLAFPLSRLILKWRAEEVEMVCDEVATARTSAPLDIADALVKLRRQTLNPVACASTAVSASGFSSENELNFERRVHRLVRLADAPPDTTRAVALSRSASGNNAIFVLTLFASSILLFTLIEPLAVHTAAEVLIQLFN